MCPAAGDAGRPEEARDPLLHSSHLPKGFRLTSVTITYDEPGPDENSAGRFPLYNLEYGDNHGGSFTIESAREGIGDRNLMETEDSEETNDSIALRPDVSDLHAERAGEKRPKVEIKANWAEDANMKSEKAKDPLAHPVLGRYHGFSATGITVAEFGTVISSLKPIRP